MATVRTHGDRITEIQINPVDGLEHYLKAVEGQPRQGRLKCDGRSILLVSPGRPHESASDQFETLLKEIFDVLDIDAVAMRSTLYRLPEPDQNKAFEPDQSYYIGNWEKVLGRDEIDLSAYPPPDLVVEVVDTNPALRSMGICLSLRVPEVWVYEVRKRRLVFKGLTEEAGQPACYRDLEHSRVLPFLTPAEVAPWGEETLESSNGFKRRVRQWVETEILPRHRG